MLEFVHIVWTISLLVIFIAIVAWTWSGSQRQRFERAALAPLLDEEIHVQSVLRTTTEGSTPFPLTLDPLILPSAPHTGGEGNESTLRATVNKVHNHG